MGAIAEVPDHARPGLPSPTRDQVARYAQEVHAFGVGSAEARYVVTQQWAPDAQTRKTPKFVVDWTLGDRFATNFGEGWMVRR